MLCRKYVYIYTCDVSLLIYKQGFHIASADLAVNTENLTLGITNPGSSEGGHVAGVNGAARNGAGDMPGPEDAAGKISMRDAVGVAVAGNGTGDMTRPEDAGGVSMGDGEGLGFPEKY